MTPSVFLTAQFWQATAERTVRTAAQAALAVIGTGALGITDVDWPVVASAAALAAVACVLTCVVAAKTGSPDGSGDSPAFGPAEADLLAGRAPYPSHDSPSD